MIEVKVAIYIFIILLAINEIGRSDEGNIHHADSSGAFSLEFVKRIKKLLYQFEMFDRRMHRGEHVSPT